MKRIFEYVVHFFFISVITILFGLSITGVFLQSCSTDTRPVADEVIPETVIPNDSNFEKFRVMRIDGCQYIHYTSFKRAGLTHKGNCNNPIHIYKDTNSVR